MTGLNLPENRHGGFFGTVEQVRRAPPGAVAAVMLTPDYDRWINGADALRRCIEAVKNGSTAVPVRAEPSLTDEAIDSHLAKHGQFALELAILSRSNTNGAVLVLGGVLQLGMWGVNIRVPAGGVLTWSVKAADNKVTLLLGDTLYDLSSCTRGMARPSFSNHSLAVDDRIECCERVILLDACLSAQALRALADALDFIKIARPHLAADIAYYTHAIVLNDQVEPDRAIPFGLIPCGQLSSPIHAAEALIRGVAHAVVQDLRNSDTFGESAAEYSANSESDRSAFAAATSEIVADLQVVGLLKSAAAHGFCAPEARCRLNELYRPIHQTAQLLSKQNPANPLVSLLVARARRFGTNSSCN